MTRDSAAAAPAAASSAPESTLEPQRQPLLEVRGLTASYRGEEGERIAAIRDVSFELYPGEVLALVGESGAGKSSVGHAVLGLLPSNASVEAGEIRYRGRSLLEMRGEELRRLRGAEIAMIFQDGLSALTPTLTVAEQLAELFRAHRRLSERDARAAGIEALRGVLPDAERVADAYPFQLSGGMAQRVMVTLATALEPSVIIADEPTASLDAGVRMDTLARLERLRDEQGVGILLITHDFGVVARLADRVAVMYAGAIVETADVTSAFRRPRHPYTYGLLQSIPGIAPGRLQPLRGSPPDLAGLDEHCAFLARCNKATSRCRIEPEPPLLPMPGSAAGHRAACYNPVALPADDEAAG